MNQIRVNSREARTKWRDLLDFIQNHNNEIIIERYGKPIGKLVPFQENVSESDTLPALKEAALGYQTAVLTPMNNQSSPNLRTDLIQQLETLPPQTLQTVQQLLQLIASAAAPPQPASVQHVPTDLATHWVGLVGQGYDGDAIEDSESLYE